MTLLSPAAWAIVRPVLSRVLAVALIWASTWTARTLGIPISAETQAHVTELTLGLLAYALVHRAVSSKINPEDAARAG